MYIDIQSLALFAFYMAIGWVLLHIIGWVLLEGAILLIGGYYWFLSLFGIEES